jgi:hypothetical protein
MPRAWDREDGHSAWSEALTLVIIAKKPETAQYLICFIFTKPNILVYNAVVSEKTPFLHDQNS